MTEKTLGASTKKHLHILSCCESNTFWWTFVGGSHCVAWEESKMSSAEHKECIRSKHSLGSSSYRVMILQKLDNLYDQRQARSVGQSVFCNMPKISQAVPCWIMNNQAVRKLQHTLQVHNPYPTLDAPRHHLDALLNRKAYILSVDFFLVRLEFFFRLHDLSFNKSNSLLDLLKYLNTSLTNSNNLLTFRLTQQWVRTRIGLPFSCCPLI